MSKEPDVVPTVVQPPWICFHCGFTTQDDREAEAHFGDRDEEEPLCKTWLHLNEDGRLGLVQDLQQQLDYERKDNTRLRGRVDDLEYQVDGQRAAIHSFKPFRQCDTIKDVFNVYDSMEGRALAAEERSGLCVLQEWVMRLSRMQQTVMLTATRAPDGLRKKHPVKVLCRWLRRCYLVSAFDKCVLASPYEPGGGSFMGPCQTQEVKGIDSAANMYIETGDEIPLHFHFHFSQAAEILGYKHPEPWVREWWLKFYLRLAAFGHLNPETEAAMDLRLSDNRDAWAAREA